MTAYFVREDAHTFGATPLTGGAWSPTEQHIAPMYGLVTHALEQYAAEHGTPGLVLCRLAVEILGVIRIEPVEVHVETVRPGRTIQLLEATVTQNDRAVVRARGWFLQPSDSSAAAGGAAGPLPAGVRPFAEFHRWPGEFIRSLRGTVVADPEPGRAQVWLETSVPLVDDEPVSDLARFLALADCANGVAARQDPDVWMFPNVDGIVNLHRRPVLEPGVTRIGLDTRVVFGDGGIGLTSSVLHDAHGEVGRLQQTLTLRRRG